MMLSSSGRSTLLLIGSLALLVGIASAADKKSPPPFFLQDPKDSLCLSGDDFRRCSIDTLFYVVGSPGNYQIHKRPLEEAAASSGDDDGVCLSKKTCTATDQDVKILSCSHCGSKEWNILGDAETGYVLTEGGPEGSKLCLVRTPDHKAILASCDSDQVTYTPLQLQFASESDITAMSSPAARFMGAANDGDKKLLQQLLKDKVVDDVNVRDWDELTALIPAASAGHVEAVKFLLQKGADVDAADKDGITALMEAAIMGHTKVVEHLIKDGNANVDATAKSGVTAVWLAAGEGKTDVIQSLLDAGASASNTRLDGITALMTASVSGHEAVVKLLLEQGADPTVSDGDGLTPLMNAAEHGSVACLQALVTKVGEENQKDYLNEFSKTGFSALIIASAHGHKDAVTFLLQAGADVNAIHDDNQVTALMYAAASGHLDVMKVLLEDGKADLHALHSNGGTALLEAATGGEPAAMQVLLEAGAKYNFVDADGVSPLMAVASQGHAEGQKHILDRLQQDLKDPDELKKHVNTASYSGGTSVMFAAAGGHVECTQQLIDLGADINAIARATPEYLEKLQKMIDDGQVDQDDDPHVDGVTAVHVAAQGGHLDCVKLLVTAGADVTVQDDESRTALQLAVKGNFGEVAAELVRAGADPNTLYVDEDGESHNLLMDAIMVENLDFATLLVEKGAALYHKDERKVSTILQASHRGLTDIVKLLLEKHASSSATPFLNEASDEGITPLISAASEGHVEVVTLLLEQTKSGGLDLNAKDKDGTNALMAASARGHNLVVELLLKAGAAVNEQNADGHTALMFAYNGKNQVETLWERYSHYVEHESDAASSEDDGGTGPIIREALDNHTALVDMLLKSGADAALKDKEGHQAKDFDFHPDADAEVLEKEATKEKVRDASKNEL